MGSIGHHTEWMQNGFRVREMYINVCRSGGTSLSILSIYSIYSALIWKAKQLDVFRHFPDSGKHPADLARPDLVLPESIVNLRAAAGAPLRCLDVLIGSQGWSKKGVGPSQLMNTQLSRQPASFHGPSNAATLRCLLKQCAGGK